VTSSWFLFFSYHNAVRSNKHQIITKCSYFFLCIWCCWSENDPSRSKHFTTLKR